MPYSEQRASAAVEAPPPETAHIEIDIRSEGSEKHLEGDFSEVLLGRDPSCPICLPDRHVGRRRARLLRRDGAWWIEDLGGESPIAIVRDGEERPLARHHGLVPVRDRDVIRIACYEAELLLDETAGAFRAPFLDRFEPGCYDPFADPAPASTRARLGELLVRSGACSAQDVADALRVQASDGGLLGEILVRLERTTRVQVARALAEQQDIPFVDLGQLIGERRITPELLALVPAEIAHERTVFPVGREGGTLLLATARPLDSFDLDSLRYVLGLDVAQRLSSRDAIEAAIRQFYDLAQLVEGLAAPAEPFAGKDAMPWLSEQPPPADAPAKTPAPAEPDEPLAIDFEWAEDRMGIAESADDLILEDSTSDSVIAIGDIMTGQSKREEEIVFDTAEERRSISPHDTAAGLPVVEAPSVNEDMGLIETDSDAALVEVGSAESFETDQFELMEEGCDDDDLGGEEIVATVKGRGTVSLEAAMLDDDAFAIPPPPEAGSIAPVPAQPAPEMAPPPPPAPASAPAGFGMAMPSGLDYGGHGAGSASGAFDAVASSIPMPKPTGSRSRRMEAPGRARPASPPAGMAASGAAELRDMVPMAAAPAARGGGGPMGALAGIALGAAGAAIGAAGAAAGAAVEGVKRMQEQSKDKRESRKARKKKLGGKADHAMTKAGAAGVVLQKVTTYERRTTVRWYSQMNPQRTFPFMVIFSLHEVEKIIAQHVEQKQSKKRLKIKESDPFVRVVPHIPGCICVPPERSVDTRPAKAEGRFHVTPIAEGEIEDAYVELFYEGKVVDRIPIPTRSVAQTATKAAGFFAVASPVMSQVLESYGLDIADRPAQTMTMFAKVVNALGGTSNAGFVFFAGLAMTTLVLYLRRRPKAAPPMTKFFDTSALMPEVDAADEALAGYRARLLVFAPKAHRVFDVDRKEMTIGGAPSADIRIDAPEVLAAHAAIEFSEEQGGFCLVDRSDGEAVTTVNGVALPAGGSMLLEGDVFITFGRGTRAAAWFHFGTRDPAVDGAARGKLVGLLRDSQPARAAEIVRALGDGPGAPPLREAIAELILQGIVPLSKWRMIRSNLATSGELPRLKTP